MEVGGGDIPQFRGDQDIPLPQGRQLGADILLGEDIDHLQGHPHRRIQGLPIQQGGTQVDGDDHIGA